MFPVFLKATIDILVISDNMDQFTNRKPGKVSQSCFDIFNTPTYSSC